MITRKQIEDAKAGLDYLMFKHRHTVNLYISVEMENTITVCLELLLDPEKVVVPVKMKKKRVPKEHGVDDDCNCEYRGFTLGWNECVKQVAASPFKIGEK